MPYLCTIALTWLAVSMLDEPLVAYEKEMAQNPLDAILIARKAADDLAGQDLPVKKLFQKAAEVQEKILYSLDERRVGELAECVRQTLENPQEAWRIKQRWLKNRAENLTPGDTTSRINLAKLALKWVNDKKLSAQLCREALDIDPEFAPAEKMLWEELQFRKTAKGWVGPAETDLEQTTRNIRPGMTPRDVQSVLGPPSRIARQILNRRLVEQWYYDGPSPRWVEFTRGKGQEAHVLNVQEKISSHR